STAPVVSEVDDFELSPVKFRGKRRWPSVMVGLAAVGAAGYAFAMYTPAGHQMLSNLSRQLPAVAAAPPPLPAAPLPTPAAAPAPRPRRLPATSPASDTRKPAEAKDARFSDDMKSRLLDADKARAAQKKARAAAVHANSAPAPHKSGPSPFPKGGNPHDPLNS